MHLLLLPFFVMLALALLVVKLLFGLFFGLLFRPRIRTLALFAVIALLVSKWLDRRSEIAPKDRTINV